MDLLDFLELIVEDEEASNDDVEQDDDDLHPAIKETFLAPLQRPLLTLIHSLGRISANTSVKGV